MSSLMTTRRFAPLFWTQFFSAFNDNVLKNTLVFFILWKLAGPEAQSLVSLAGALFIAPFFFLSSIGGEIADRYDKALVAQRLKLVEIGVAAIAVLGLALPSLPLLFVALVLFGVIAALFGPIKYGILPDHLAESELPRANALVETATFIAIIAGTVVGGYAAAGGGNILLFGALMMGMALACWASSLMIPPTGEGAPDLKINPNILASTFTLLKELKADKRLWWGGLVVSWFWLAGAVTMGLLPVLVKDVLGGTEAGVSLCLATFSIAIAVGSGLASWLASGRIVLLPTVLGAVLMGGFAIDLGFAAWGVSAGGTPVPLGDLVGMPLTWRVLVDLAGMAIGGGLFIVPSFAAIQAWAGKDRRARVVAAVNILNAGFMVAGALGIAGLQSIGLSVAGAFFVLGLSTLAAAVAILFTLPTNPLRDFVSILFRAFYRTEVRGLENVAKAGPNAIIALNHVSFLDAALAVGSPGTELEFAL